MLRTYIICCNGAAQQGTSISVYSCLYASVICCYCSVRLDIMDVKPQSKRNHTAAAVGRRGINITEHHLDSALSRCGATSDKTERDDYGTLVSDTRMQARNGA